MAKSKLPHEMNQGAMVSILLAVVGCGAPHASPEQAVARFFTAQQAHDVERVMELLHQDYVFRDQAGTFSVTRSGVRPMLEWDAGVGWRGEASVVETEADTVRVRLRETNDFLELLGLGPLRTDVAFVVAGGMIREAIAGSGAEMQQTVDAAVAPVLEWARATDPAKLRGLVEDGNIVYDGRSAEGWIRLLREAREAGVIRTDGS